MVETSIFGTIGLGNDGSGMRNLCPSLPIDSKNRMRQLTMIQRRARAILAAFLFFAASCQPASANPSLLVDVDTGAVLAAEDATTPWHPASTAKLMTVYLALKAVKQGQLTLDTPIAGTRRASAQRPSKIGIRPGQIITHRQCAEDPARQICQRPRLCDRRSDWRRCRALRRADEPGGAAPRHARICLHQSQWLA